MDAEYLIEGRDGGSTVLRVVHSGLLGDDWQDEYDALRRGWPFHLHTLREYLTHFPGRAGVPVFAVAHDGRAAGAGGPGGTHPRAVAADPGRRGRAGARRAGRPAAAGRRVVWSDDERIEIRTADGIYTFHGSAAWC